MSDSPYSRVIRRRAIIFALVLILPFVLVSAALVIRGVLWRYAAAPSDVVFLTATRQTQRVTTSPATTRMAAGGAATKPVQQVSVASPVPTEAKAVVIATNTPLVAPVATLPTVTLPPPTTATPAPTPTAANVETTGTAATTITASTTAVASADVATPFEARPAPGSENAKFAPLFGPAYATNDGKPTFVCATLAFGSYLTLMQMQVTGKDVAHGFHLGIVPLDLSEQYLGDGRDDERMLAAGKLDCMVDTVDNVARHGSGPITIIIDESAGGDGIYARGVPSMYDLKGKRVAYVANDSSEFFIRYVLRIANISPKELTLLPYDTSAAAVEAFNRNEADAVSAYDPELVKATASGGVPLVTSDALRAIIDVILTSNVSIKAKPQLVQAFHHAWFATIKAQAEDYEAAAQAIAAWGNNDWTGVSKENAVRDFEGQLQRIAQANLKNNTNTMQFPAPIINHLELSRKIWSDVSEVSQIAPEALVEPRFVISAAQSLALQTSVKLINNTYSLSAATQPTALARANASASASTNPTATVPVTDIVQVDQAVVTTMDTVTATSVISTTVTAVPTPPTTINAGETLSVLPCKRFTFLPNSVELTAESRQTLDLCVLPLLQQRATMLLRVRGSAGWPGPAKSTEYEERVRRTAAQRAQAVVNYLISRGIDSARFLIETALPPPERRGINDARTAQDRFVEMSIVSGN